MALRSVDRDAAALQASTHTNEKEYGLINNFAHDAENAITELRALVCRYADDFHTADNRHSARDYQTELAKAIARELISDCRGDYHYELRHIPEWMAGIARPFRM